MPSPYCPRQNVSNGRSDLAMHGHDGVEPAGRRSDADGLGLAVAVEPADHVHACTLQIGLPAAVDAPF
jgi:hypothetical protein